MSSRGSPTLLFRRPGSMPSGTCPGTELGGLVPRADTDKSTDVAVIVIKENSDIAAGLWSRDHSTTGSKSS